jgi:hypothetical protein
MSGGNGEKKLRRTHGKLRDEITRRWRLFADSLWFHFSSSASMSSAFLQIIEKQWENLRNQCRKFSFRIKSRERIFSSFRESLGCQRSMNQHVEIKYLESIINWRKTAYPISIWSNKRMLLVLAKHTTASSSAKFTNGNFFQAKCLLFRSHYATWVSLDIILNIW